MTMAAEFPDVFQLFDSPKPKMTLAMDSKGIKDVKARDCVRAGSESTIQEKSTTAKRRGGTDPEPSGRKKQSTSKDGGSLWVYLGRLGQTLQPRTALSFRET